MCYFVEEDKNGIMKQEIVIYFRLGYIGDRISARIYISAMDINR